MNLLLMCADIVSPGTLREVLRGYTVDPSAPQRIANDEAIDDPPLPPIRESLFTRLGGTGFQRRFELATTRLIEMGEVLGHWRAYVPRDGFVTQRGGTFLLDHDEMLSQEHRQKRVLGFSEMASRLMLVQKEFVLTSFYPVPTQSCNYRNRLFVEYGLMTDYWPRSDRHQGKSMGSVLPINTVTL